MLNWGASFSLLGSQSVIIYILKGAMFTVVLSVVAVLISLIIGSVFALLRNYCTHGGMRVLKWVSIVYIEIFRNTPLLLWIFVCLVFCPVPEIFAHKMFGITSVEMKILFRAMVALVLYTSSVVAEIVRGGLNSVAQGQFEAGHSQGFSTVQIMWYIVLPQAFKAIVPTLLSQVITTIKDSSYLANVAVIELMACVRQMVSTSYRFNGTGTQLVSDVFVLFGLACVIYFVINFTLSCVVRRMQKGTKRAPGGAA